MNRRNFLKFAGMTAAIKAVLLPNIHVKPDKVEHITTPFSKAAIYTRPVSRELLGPLRPGTTGPFGGKTHFWEAYLTNDELAQLAAGADPKTIRPDKFVF